MLCPVCSREMRVVALFDEREVTERILHHLGLWEEGVRLNPARAPPDGEGIVEEPWVELGNTADVMNADWPVVNEEALKRDELQLAVQVNGKVPSSASKEEIEAIARASEKIQIWLEGKTVRKVIVVPGRRVNIAVS